MRHNYWVLAGLTLAIGLSGISLGLQVKQRTSKFEKYRTTSPSDLQFRFLEADVASLRERMPAASMGSFCSWIHVRPEEAVMRAIVLSADLPKSIDERRYAFMVAATSALSGFNAAFRDDPDLKSDRDVVVEFLDVTPVVKDKKPEVIATFENGEVTFH
jgi:hypothetical protein